MHTCTELGVLDVEQPVQVKAPNKLKFGYSEKATQFEKIFHLKFDATQ